MTKLLAMLFILTTATICSAQLARQTLILPQEDASIMLEGFKVEVVPGGFTIQLDYHWEATDRTIEAYKFGFVLLDAFNDLEAVRFNEFQLELAPAPNSGITQNMNIDYPHEQATIVTVVAFVYGIRFDDASVYKVDVDQVASTLAGMLASSFDPHLIKDALRQPNR